MREEVKALHRSAQKLLNFCNGGKELGDIKEIVYFYLFLSPERVQSAR